VPIGADRGILRRPEATIGSARACILLGVVGSLPGASARAEVSFVQATSAVTRGPLPFAVAFASPNDAGSAIIVTVSWTPVDAGPPVLTDDQGNTYHGAAGPTRGPGGNLSAYAVEMFYSIGTRASGRPTKVLFDGGATTRFDVVLAEYAGIEPDGALDATSIGISDAGTDMDSGTLVTTAAGDLLVAWAATQRTATDAGPGFTARQLIEGDLLEDAIAGAPGPYVATAPEDQPGFIVQFAAFKPAPPAAGPPSRQSLWAACASSPGTPWKSWLLPALAGWTLCARRSRRRRCRLVD
jgi:hypothetical protein